jgi:hypothetical protein
MSDNRWNSLFANVSIFSAIESMFDLVKRYSRKKDFNLNDSLFIKLKQVN